MLNSSGCRPARCSVYIRALLPCSLDRLNWPVQTHRQHARTHARTHWLSSIHHSLLLRAEAKLTDSTGEGEEAQKNQAAKMTTRLCALPE